ncbi:DedA family protein [Pengzhenrongella sicca]|uniref:VTT domain-containing protein n=1 Tax=Pengzhenrongella sicca TaxID=2819238 RepID=A0A8A4ZDB8_9MICO|nr:VTT domain-containing protein [Pengzhenrongella sicca]QTE28467.1 VTT domain-containing protein [Pengzhenrongella sicca]
MNDVPAVLGLDRLTFPALVAALFVIVLLRAQATYWLGRAVRSSTVRLGRGHPPTGWWGRVVMAVERWSRSAGGRRALALVRRWGALAVTLSFFTVGVQTAVNAAAGLSRMPFARYLLAMAPGCLAWALIYATVGFAAFYGAVALAAGSPWALAGAAALLAAGVAALAVRRRRRVGSAADGGAAG